MNRSTPIVVLVCSMLGYAAAPVALAATTNLGRIMPMGDSITHGGGGTNAGYRGPLHNLLTSANAFFQFAGDSTLNPGSLPANQSQHAGHSSYTTYDIAHNLDGVDYARYQAFGGADRDPNGGYWLTGGHETGRDAIAPNFVLLLVGVNDLAYGQDANAGANLSGLLTKLTTLVPNANILIADLPPSTCYGTARIDSWNSAVDTTASYFQDQGKHVTVVDLNTAFPSNGLSGDGVHPNDIGYIWMAKQWSNSITALAVPEPSSLGLLTMAMLIILFSMCRRRKQASRLLVNQVEV